MAVWWEPTGREKGTAIQELASAVYWTVTGGVMAFGGLALMTIGLPFLVVGLVMAVLGMFLLEFKGVWAITVGFAAVPAYIVLRQAWEATVSSGPTCTREGATGVTTVPARSGADDSAVVSSCSPPMPEGLISILVVLGLFALSGPAVRLLMLVRGRFA